MPKYLVQGSYTDQGLKGLLKEGGSKRRAMVEQLANEMGGKLEAFYYAFGSDDFVIILDLPSNMDMAATAIVAQASGMVKSRVTVLMTPEDVDQASFRGACRLTLAYRSGPGFAFGVAVGANRPRQPRKFSFRHGCQERAFGWCHPVST